MADHPDNEPILGYAPGSEERALLHAEMDRQMDEVVEIPCIINGEAVYTGVTTTQVIPHDHGHIIANVHLAGRVETSWDLAGRISKTESHETGRGDKTWQGGSTFLTYRGLAFMNCLCGMPRTSN